MASFTDIDRLHRLVVNTAAGSTVALVAAVTGKRIKVYSMFLKLASSTTLDFKSATTSLTGAMTATELNMPPMKFGETMVPYFQTTAGEALNVTFGGAVQCSGVLFYTDDDA